MLHDLNELEQAVLACMASSPRAATKVRAILEPGDFTSDDHRTVFAQMVEMVDEGRRIDQLTLVAELRKATYENEVLAVAQNLYAVASSLASVDHAEEYAGVIREESVRRSLTRRVDRALGQKADVEEVVSGVEAAVFSARSRMQGKRVGGSVSGGAILSPLEAFLSAPETDGGYPYPLPSMRRKYGLYERGRYTILGGNSGDGKTTMAFQWIEELCEAGARVRMYEMELTEKQVGVILTLQGAALTQQQTKRIDPINLEDTARFAARKKQIDGWGFDLKCGPTTPMEIRADQARDPVDVIFVDHMQKFQGNGDGDRDYSGGVNKTSTQLHRITRDLNCSLVCLAQLRKAQTDMQGRLRKQMPTTASLRGTNQLEEDADDVLLMWQDRDELDRRMGTGSLIIGKMRDGQPDQMVPFRFDDVRTKFFETTPEPPKGPSVLQRRQGGNA